MSFQAEQKLKMLQKNARTDGGAFGGGAAARNDPINSENDPVSRPENSADSWAPSHLETILGRINSVMSDPFASRDASGMTGAGQDPRGHAANLHHGQSSFDAQSTHQTQSQSFMPQAGGDQPGFENGFKRGAVFQSSASQFNSPAQGQSFRRDEWSVEETPTPEGFVPSEPTDMLQPYSEVLNEVRDYFNDRHSLDPNQRLMDEQNRRSIADDMQGFNNQGEFGGSGFENVPQFNSEDAAQNERGSQGAEAPQPLKLWDEDPFDARPKEISEFKPAKSVDSIFTPIKFANPFTRDHSSVELFTPENNDLKQLRVELVDRISQLEQVLGHHFGDRQEVANEAAQSAIQMMLKNLDDSALGQRLADIETAFVLFQKSQDEKNKATSHTLQKLGAALTKIAPDMKVADLIGVAPAAELLKTAGADGDGIDGLATEGEPATSEQQGQSARPQNEEKAVLTRQARPADEASKDAALMNDETGSDRVGSERVGTDGSSGDMPENMAEGSEIGNGDLHDGQRLPMSAFDPSRSGKGAQLDAGAQPPAVPYVLAQTEPSSLTHPLMPPLTSVLSSAVTEPQNIDDETEDDDGVQMEQAGLSPSPQDLAEDEQLGTIDQLRKVLSEGQTERSFGKQEQAEMVNENTDDIYREDFLGKTAALRDQFNRSQIVSNDEDLYNIGQRKSRLPIVVVVIALLLAAMAIVFKNNSKDIEAVFFNIYETVRGAIDGSSKSPQKDTELIKGDGTTKTSLSEEKSDDGTEEDDPSTTGNIGSKRLAGRKKINPRLSDDQKDAGIDPELLLPKVNGVLGLPPALIGPYSLRHAAANGDPSAQYEVARRFSLGQGVPKDHDLAVKWYMHGAAQGFAPSQYRLATYFERGLSVAKNVERARIWYKRAAELGNLKAMHNLAVVSTSLNQKRSDYKEAIYWFMEAANHNLADSQFNLAILYQNGVGLDKNNVEAYKWFSLAARQGDLDASIRRDGLEKKLTKVELLAAARQLQAWKPLTVNAKANTNGLISSHMTSTLSHANETIERSRVLTAQILLRKLGYKLEEVDGLLNDQTIAAIKKFEKDKGMTITGKITPELVQHLNKAAI